MSISGPSGEPLSKDKQKELAEEALQDMRSKAEATRPQVVRDVEKKASEIAETAKEYAKSAGSGLGDFAFKALLAYFAINALEDFAFKSLSRRKSNA